MNIRLTADGVRTVSIDASKILADPLAVSERLGLLRQSHIEPLSQFVEGLRKKVGPEAVIPHFDPWDGGIEAEILFLFEAAGPKAVRSGFISRNNPDETAKNFFELALEAGLDRKRTVLWNAVPWYIGTGKKIRAANAADLAQGLESLKSLLDLLPKIQRVVFVGRKAQKARPLLDPARYELLSCPHPSPVFVNRKPGNRARILEVLKSLC